MGLPRLCPPLPPVPDGQRSIAPSISLLSHHHVFVRRTPPRSLALRDPHHASRAHSDGFAPGAMLSGGGRSESVIEAHLKPISFRFPSPSRRLVASSALIVSPSKK